MKYLIDANVFREYGRSGAHVNVAKWFSSVDDHLLAISTWTVKESRKGIEGIREQKPKEAAAIERRLLAALDAFDGRILSIDKDVAHALGAMLAESGRYPDDAVLAATAKVYGLTVVTRNVDHFRRRGVPLLNPYKEPPEIIQP